jgi:hypothetical protein
MEESLHTHSKIDWSLLRPAENQISADADTAESAAFRSRLYHHLSNDGLDYVGQRSHPAIIEDPMQRERWATSALQQIQDLVCIILFMIRLILIYR